MKKKLTIGIMVFTLVLGVLAGCGGASTSQRGESKSVQFEPEKALGDFETVDLNGNPINQDIFKEADLTFVQVWGTYCGPCQAELPTLAALANHYPANNIQFIGIILDGARQDGSVKEEQVAEARRLLEGAQITYLQLLPNGEMISNTQLKAVKALPTSFFVDKEGKVVKNAYIGVKSLEEWKTIFDSLLEEKDLPVPTGVLMLPEESQAGPLPEEGESVEEPLAEEEQPVEQVPVEEVPVEEESQEE